MANIEVNEESYYIQFIVGCPVLKDRHILKDLLNKESAQVLDYTDWEFEGNRR